MRFMSFMRYGKKLHGTRALARVLAIGVLGVMAHASAQTGDIQPAQLYSKKASFAETLLATRAAMAQACAADPGIALKVWALVQKDFPIECDWMRQDAGAGCGRWLAEDDGSETLSAMLKKTLPELDARAVATLRREVETLDQAQNAPTPLPQRLNLYLKACELRRAARLKPVLARSPRIIFTKHYIMGGSHYAYTEGQSDAQAEHTFVPGSALCLLTMDGTRGKVETLLEDAHGVIRDPDVSYDGKRILFSWKKSDRKDDYHLYEMDFASRRTRQITSGEGVADYEGAYLPNGEILFNSTRCVQTVDCWWTEVSNLYACAGDGRFMRRLTFDQVHDNYPTVTGDGRILYTRWEYNDRGQIFPQPLFQMNADGTNQAGFYGVNSFFPTTILHARAIPGSGKVVAIAAGHHTRQTGKLILIDPNQGREEAEGIKLIAPERETRAEKIDKYGQEGELFQYPYPLSEQDYLVAYCPTGWVPPGEDGAWNQYDGNGSVRQPFGIYLVTRDGRRELLAWDDKLPCGQPVPLAPRPLPHPRPSMVDYRRNDGTVYVQDVYAGPGLAGIKRGTVKTLRVVKLDFRAAGIGRNGNDHALISTPVAIGNGAWDPKTILGDAPVCEDGSVFFTAPARTPFYFQLLDEKGRMVQSMRSWTTLQPGENASCVGCHESRNSTPLDSARPTLALKAGPLALKEFYGPPRGFSFAREIQPILDRHCIQCHDGKPGHQPSLLGRPYEDKADVKRRWSDSYVFLTGARRREGREDASPLTSTAREPLVNWISAQSPPPLLAPYSAGSARSRLIESLEKKQKDYNLTREEMDKLAAWIDLGVPFCGDYIEANAWTPEELARYRHFEAKRRTYADLERQAIKAHLLSVSDIRSAGNP